MFSITTADHKEAFRMQGELAIKEQIIKFISDYFVKDTGMIVKDDTSFLDEGILDSTGVMELVAYIESTFKIRIEDEEIIPDNFDSITKLLTFVKAKLNSRSGITA
jgi:acyl carrier protein